MYQYYAFETFLVLILVLLIYLNNNQNLDYRYVLIYLFFFVCVTPFIFYKATIKEKFIDYNSDMQSSLDIYYLNAIEERRKDDCKTCSGLCDEEYIEEENKYAFLKQKYYKNPVQIELEPQNIKQIDLSAQSNISGDDFKVQLKIENGLFQTLNPISKSGLNMFYFPFEELVTYDGSKNYFEKNYFNINLDQGEIIEKLKTYLNNIPKNSYVIIGLKGTNLKEYTTTINIFKTEINDLITEYKLENFNKIQKNYLALLKKDNTFKLLKEILTNNEFNYNLTGKTGKYFKIKELGVKLNNVEVDREIRSILSEDYMKSEYMYISPKKMNSFLCFESDNNHSLVFLSKTPIDNPLQPYYETPDVKGLKQSTLYLQNNIPQKWTFISNTPSGYDGLFRIQTYQRPYFYLEMNNDKVTTTLIDNGSAGLWRIKNINGKYLIISNHTGKYLSYNNDKTVIYEDSGKVYGSDDMSMLWDLVLSKEKRDVTVPRTLENVFTDYGSPNDYPTIEDPKFDVKGHYFGKKIDLTSNGRGLWQNWFAPVWNGVYVYGGTIKDKTKFFRINVSNDGKSGVAKDEYLNKTYNIKSVGSNILFGYEDKNQIYIKMISNNLGYENPKKSYPIKIQIIVNDDVGIKTLCGDNPNNLNAYSVKYDGEDKILSNYLESYGIPVGLNQKLGVGLPK